MVTKEQVLDALKRVMDPELRRSIVELGMVREVAITGHNVKVTIALTIPNCPMQEQIATDAAQVVDALADDLDVEIALTTMTEEEKTRMRDYLQAQQREQQPNFPAGNLNRVKTVIAVMSGKGGVGKSTVAAMLAVELRRHGLRVGVLDSDITGPSIPKLFGISESPIVSPLGIMPPGTSSGIKIMSINLMLQREEDAVIWRGPMISGAIQQFWNDVFWGDLDVLVVDMPPGTSDAALTVMQSLPVTGIVLVASPQDLAEMVVRKAANMAGHLQIPLIGIVENMSYVTCPKCGERFELFGAGKTEEMARAFDTRFLGKLGLDPDMTRLGDSGQIEMYENDEIQPMVEFIIQIVADALDPHPHKHTT
ncbi:MAG: Mrp/NBP35 family ATP-binding protein [Anaerolineae bacterium]|nr:Mrp/NBP35 family ATP-binding protein [Anaerolineae bacterium]